MITLKQIQYALNVEKTKHFKNAAQQCFVSQSALSTAISEMENQLGVQIFERDNKQVLITAIGVKVLEHFKKIKQQTDDLYTVIASLDQPLNTPMSIGVIPTIGPYLLPKILPSVRKKYPDFKMTIIEEQSHVLVDKVKSGELDTAILALPYPTEGLHVFEFWQEDFYFVCSTMQSMITNISSDQIQTSELMLLQDGHCLKDHALAACSLPMSAYNQSLGGTSLYTLVQMVAGNMGVTLVPQMALSSLVEINTELQFTHLNEPGPHRKIAMITRLNYPAVNNIELLMSLFKQSLQKD
ncbi:hydrogen peroxide-inducible genes activator [Marinicellulosiphila megalodicopiae]|uniref:hydrogen peroxide-inducible genes activator n=1 Tax=Marinicellulosiphila megalodicopiae TaxID=2724896 RepID=UPI003BAE3305